MKMLMRGLTLKLAMAAAGAQADQIVKVDGEDYLLSDLTKNCQNITDDPSAQIACFASLSQLIAEQGGETGNNDEVVLAAAEALQAAAGYQDEESGLIIRAEGCTIQFIYYGNYFHISRRNISSVDLFAATIDVSKMMLDQTVPVQGSQVPMLRATMAFGSTASVQGGLALESGPGSFASRAPGAPLADFANEVVGLLPASDSQSAEFVLVHPKQTENGAAILTAFQEYVVACQG